MPRFDIKLSRDKLICEMTDTPPSHRLIKPTSMTCVVELHLGIVPSAPASKALKKGMSQTLNSLVKTRSGGLLKDINQKVVAIGKMLDSNDPQKAQAVRDSEFLQNEETQLVALWKHWSEKIAPRLANQALQEVIKSTREKDLAGLSLKKVKAVGRVTAVPVLALVSAAVSGATGNIAGVLSALAKSGSAIMKASDELSSTLNEFKTDQAALEKDLSAVSAALKTVATRIKSMDRSRKTTEMRIAALAAQTQSMTRELAALKPADRQAADTLAKSIQANTKAMQALKNNLPETDTLKAAWQAMAAEYKKMMDAVGAMSAQTPKNLRTARDLTDGGKELLSILSKVG